MDEQKAVLAIEQAAGHDYRYEGDDEAWKGSVGYFKVLDDMNCCAATNNVLFAFYTGTKRKVMNATELLDFMAQCKQVEL